MYSVDRVTKWRFEEEEGKSIKEKVPSLKSLCVDKIVAKLRFYPCAVGDTRRYNKEFGEMRQKFRLLGPVLGEKILEKAHDCKIKPLELVLLYMVWNVKMLRFHWTTGCNSRYLTGWLQTNCSNLTHVSFVGCRVSEQLFDTTMRYCGHQLLALELDYSLIDGCFHDSLGLIGKHCNNLLKLVIWNCRVKTDRDLLNFDKLFLKSSFPHKIGYPFTNSLKVIGFPGKFHYSFENFKKFVYNLFYRYAVNLESTDLRPDYDDKVYIHKMIAKKNRSLKLKRFREIFCNHDVTFKQANKVATCLLNLEELELFALVMETHEKKTIIDNVNKNLQVLEIHVNSPITFLLYIGKKLEYLQALSVNFTHSLHFRKKNKFKGDKKLPCFENLLCDSYLRVFRHLRELKFNSMGELENVPVVETLLVILRGCEDTLERLSLEGYDLPDVRRIVDFVCKQKIKLKSLELVELKFITDEDLLRMAKLLVGDNRKLFISDCKSVTNEGLDKVNDYIIANSLEEKFYFESWIIEDESDDE